MDGEHRPAPRTRHAPTGGRRFHDLRLHRRHDMGKGDLLGEFEQMVLLAVLHQDRAGYGMTIRREIEGRTGREVSIGAVYATLDRLEEKGLVESHDGDALAERPGRARRYFALTPGGADALRVSRSMMQRMWEGADLGGVGGGG